MTQAVDLANYAASLGGGSPVTFRNKIINGACVINQRVSAFSSNNTIGYFADRWWGFTSAAPGTYSQVSSTGLAGFPFAIRAQRPNGSTATTGFYMGQIIESNNLQDLQGQTITLSFWARAGANFSGPSSQITVWCRTGTVADQGSAALLTGWTGAVDQTTNVTLTTSWQYFSRTFSVPSNAQELTTFFSFPGAGTAGANDWFDVTGVQLERGATATNFEARLFGTELVLCQRYYERARIRQNSGSSSNNPFYQFTKGFAVTKRAAPTMTNLSGGTPFVTLAGPSAVTFDVLDIGQFGFFPSNANTWSNVDFSWAASAEL